MKESSDPAWPRKPDRIVIDYWNLFHGPPAPHAWLEAGYSFDAVRLLLENECVGVDGIPYFTLSNKDPEYLGCNHGAYRARKGPHYRAPFTLTMSDRDGNEVCLGGLFTMTMGGVYFLEKPHLLKFDLPTDNDMLGYLERHIENKKLYA